MSINLARSLTSAYQNADLQRVDQRHTRERTVNEPAPARRGTTAQARTPRRGVSLAGTAPRHVHEVSNNRIEP